MRRDLTIASLAQHLWAVRLFIELRWPFLRWIGRKSKSTDSFEDTSHSWDLT
jgi:hypothetical protein